MALVKAVKSESKLRLAIVGPAGSGKTYSALSIASGLSNRIALFDTEHGSASKYADLFDFDVDEIKPPFHPNKFVEAIDEAVKGGYGVVILDSLSHAWNGEGGVLDIVDQVAKRMRSPNSFAAWKDVTPLQNKLTEAIVGSGIHIIVTMRSKTEYVLQDSGNGRQTPTKVGMAPIQRDQYEYEFDVVLEMDASNNAIVTKTRCPALSSRVLPKPGHDVAATLKTWLSGAKAEATPSPKPTPTATNGAQHRQPPAQAPKPVDADAAALAASVNATVTNTSEFDAIPDAKASDTLDKARKAFHAQVASVFPKDDIDDARHWFIEKYTTAYTAGNVRTSTNNLTAAELDAMTDALKKRAKHYRDQWVVAKTAPSPAEKQPVTA